MSWDRWGWGESKPRRPADGIKAQTQRGQFGKTWWAGLWIAALERLVDSARLSRGRSYARSGQVVKLDFERAGVAALVQGSQAKPYRVAIRFKALSDEEWEKVVDAIAGQAIYAAKLLSGEMPAEIEEVFHAAGASLFPASRGDLETDCSCPDWANPCKHVAAVHYLLGERFDADPFLIFEMRGRSKEAIIEALRARRAGGSSSEGEPAFEEDSDVEENVVPLAETLDAFWSASGDVLDLAMNFSPPEIDAIPIKRLGPPVFWQGPDDFTTLMEQAYKAIASRALRLATGDD